MERIVWRDRATKSRAVKFCTGRLAEIESGKGPADLAGERAAIQEALENLTASRESLTSIENEFDRLERTKRVRDLNEREAARYEMVKALVALSNGTGNYSPEVVTQALLPYLVLFR